MSEFSITCPHCGQEIVAGREMMGQCADCPGCGQLVELSPAEPTPKPPPVAKTRSPVRDTPEKTKPDLTGKTKTSEAKRGDAGPPVPATEMQAFIVILLLCGGLAFGIYEHVRAPKTPLHQWEYAVISPADEVFVKALDTAGEQGWELVHARRATSTNSPGTLYETTSASYEVILKRPK